MYYRDRGACFEKCVCVGGGGGGGGGGRIARELLHAGRLDFIRPWPPPPPVPRSLYFCMLWREFATRNYLRLCTRLIKHKNSPLSYLSLLINLLR